MDTVSVVLGCLGKVREPKRESRHFRYAYRKPAETVRIDDQAVDQEPIEHQVLRASFLVERGHVSAFDAAMDDLAREHAGRIRFKYVGPLAPHSFVSVAPPESR